MSKSTRERSRGEQFEAEQTPVFFFRGGRRASPETTTQRYGDRACVSEDHAVVARGIKRENARVARNEIGRAHGSASGTMTRSALTDISPCPRQ